MKSLSMEEDLSTANHKLLVFKSSFVNLPFCCYSLVPLLQSAQNCSILSSLLHHTQPCVQPCLEAVPTAQLTRASYLRRLSVSRLAPHHSTDVQVLSLQQQIMC